jgi:hypothetical protein
MRFRSPIRFVPDRSPFDISAQIARNFSRELANQGEGRQMKTMNIPGLIKHSQSG